MSIIDALLCLLEEFVNYVLDGLMLGVNECIVGLAAALTAAIALLPSLPAWPTGGDWSWLNWVVPMSSFVGLGATLLSIFLTYFVARIIFRWAKAL